jgi:SAM-dependent methyltransferase
MLPSLIRPVESKDLRDIRGEWDKLAELRYAQITSGRDFSYSGILEPTIIRLLQESPFSNALDVGCGVGVLTSRITELCSRVVGLDISEFSLAFARRCNPAMHSLEFVAESVESFAGTTAERFDAIIANMMLMSSPDLTATLKAMNELLTATGRLVITITHPWFWPKYWGYESAPWFVYEHEIVLEAPFTISADGPSQFLITHIHRPLEKYVTSILNSHLSLTALVEPSLPDDAPTEYRQRWEFPRFLAFVCKKAQPV